MLRVAVLVTAGIIAGTFALYQYLSSQQEQYSRPQYYRPRNEPESSTSRGPSSSPKCDICFRSLSEYKMMNFYGECSHQFHRRCIEAILKEGQTICPVRFCMKSFV